MKTILFPTDFSKASLHAFVFALEFTKKINAKLIVLHVYEFPIIMASDDAEYLMETQNISQVSDFEYYGQGKQDLIDIASKNELDDVDYTHVFVNGDAVDEIIDNIKRHKADYIIMGTSGASGLKESFIGTVTEKVISRSAIPVFAVPYMGNNNFKIEKILFLTHYNNFRPKRFENLLKFNDVFNAAIEVLEVKENYDSCDGIEMDKWKSQFGGSNINFNLIISDEYEKVILDFINANRIGLIVFYVHHKNFIETLFRKSLPKKLTFHCPIPVLALPAGNAHNPLHISIEGFLPPFD
jgi:nucleotide-binding universal stress UspA family protein